MTVEADADAAEERVEADAVRGAESGAAGWAAADWCRSAENEGRTHGRSNSRLVLLPEVVHLTGGEWERYAKEEGEEWIERLVEEIDERAGGNGTDSR